MKTFISLLAMVALTTVVGCSKQEEEGAAEKAGKQLDQAIEKTEAHTSEKMKEMGQAVEQAGEGMEKKDEAKKE